jgi:hypothetical protein
VTNPIADVLPMHGEAVRRASGFVLVAKCLPIPLRTVSGLLFHSSPEGSSREAEKSADDLEARAAGP